MKQGVPKATVIIPARNAEDTLDACLRAQLSQTLPRRAYEVIVVDDGSEDRTALIARTHGVSCLQQTKQGPAAARNAGALQAKGEIVVFTDADCAPMPDFLEKLLSVFEDPHAVGAKGAYRSRQRQLIARFVQQEYQFKYNRMARFESIDFIDTYAAAYRRKLFLENEGFDTSFPAPSVEDQEFSFRLARKGYRMIFVPDAIVYHQHDRTLGEYLRRKFFIGYWKAYMLSWHPEKIGGDTHTPPTQQFQVGLAPLLILSVALSPVFNWALWATIVGFGLFSLSAAPLLVSIARRDYRILWITPGVVLIRALSLAAGLLVGLFSPAKPRGTQWSPLSLLQRTLKRTLDVLLAVVALALASPVILLAGLAIKLDSPGPVFFVQERVGEGGKVFRMIKLRTMVQDAEQQLESVIKNSALHGPAFKIPNDPRVTRVGRFLRRWSLDELPQIWNVLRGEMSLVGPRPEEVRVVAQYNDWHRRRLTIRPGLTGPMQVRGRGMLDLDERVRLELDYIENYSIWRDLGILLRTLSAVLSGEGSI